MAFRIETSGVQETITNLLTFAHSVDEVVQAYIHHFANEIFKLSQEYVPVRDEDRPDQPPPTGRPHNIVGGSLKATGRLFQSGPDEWAIGYGGADMGTARPVDYAVYVHEIPQIHVPPGRMKYLQSAVMEIMPQMEKEISPWFQTAFAGITAGGGKYAVKGGGFTYRETPGAGEAVSPLIEPKFGPAPGLELP